jgi:hypothetical protein
MPGKMSVNEFTECYNLIKALRMMGCRIIYCAVFQFPSLSPMHSSEIIGY